MTSYSGIYDRGGVYMFVYSHIGVSNEACLAKTSYHIGSALEEFLF